MVTLNHACMLCMAWSLACVEMAAKSMELLGTVMSSPVLRKMGTIMM